MNIEKPISDFLAHLKDLKFSESTQEARENALKCFVKWFNSQRLKRVQDVTEKHLDGYTLYLLGAVSVNTVSNYLTGLRKFFNYLEAHFIIFDNPTANMKANYKTNELPKVLSVEDIEALISACENSRCHTSGIRNSAMIQILYSTAIRREGLLNMSLDKLNVSNQSLAVIEKNRKERVVPVGKVALEALQKYLDEVRPKYLEKSKSPKTKNIWLTQDGRELNENALRGIFLDLKRRTDISFSTHTFRRSCATHLILQGCNPITVMKLLGHANAKTLNAYLKMDASHLVKELEKTKVAK
jgi:integrase/recombinase XerD